MAPPVESTYLRAALTTAIAAAVGSWLVSLLLVVGANAGGAAPTLMATLRASAHTWLVASGSGLDAGPITIGLIPVGSVLLCMAVVALAARFATRDQRPDPSAFCASVAGAYGVIGAMVASAASTAAVEISAVRAAVVMFVIGGLGALVGGVRSDDERGWPRIDQRVRLVLAAAVPGAVSVFAVAASIVLCLLVGSVAQAGDLWAALDPGPGGRLALALGSVLAIVTLTVWTASVLVGPGFSLGEETSVNLSGADVGQVPGIPVLAALPDPGQFSGWVIVLGLVPLLAGMLSGALVRAPKDSTISYRAGLGAAAGACAGLAVGIVIACSGGAIGPGRMEQAGPPVATPVLIAVATMAVGGALGAALAHYRRDRAYRPSSISESGSNASQTGRPRFWKRHQSPSVD